VGGNAVREFRVRLSFNENGHARHKLGLIALRIQTQAQGISVVVTDGAFCLPRGKGTEGHQFSDLGSAWLIPFRACYIDSGANRETLQKVLSDVERQPLLVSCVNH
jgi:hypothetical protein